MFGSCLLLGLFATEIKGTDTLSAVASKRSLNGSVVLRHSGKHIHLQTFFELGSSSDHTFPQLFKPRRSSKTAVTIKPAPRNQKNNLHQSKSTFLLMRCKGIVFNCNEDVKRLMLPEGTNKSKKEKITQFELCAERKRSRSEESDHHLKKLENT